MTAASEATESNAPMKTLKSVTRETPPTEKGHPRGLYFLFFTEMWERFGYYGMRALLVLYMINYLQWQPGESSNVYKWYTSLVYLTPLLGGFLADRFFGLRKSIVAGGALMAVGYFMLSVQSLFIPALGFIIAGNGFFKPNISTMVGKLYRQGDARRDGAFTIFYMGINLGAFLAPLILSRLRVRYGFGVGFAGAGVGMIIGLVTFLYGQRRVTADMVAAGNDLTVTKTPTKEGVPTATEDTVAEEQKEPAAGGVAGLVAKLYPVLMIGLMVAVPIYFAIKVMRGQAPLSDVIMPVAFSAIAGWMGFTLFKIKGAARDRSIVIFVIFAFAVLFWMAFEQAGNALNIWADVHTDRKIFAWHVETEDFQSVNAIFIFTLAPLFAMMWTWLARTGKEPSTPAKMLIAMVFMTLSFVAMVWGAAAENGTVSKITLSEVPAQINVSELNAGRLAYDPATHELSVHGVLPPFAVSDALKRTVSPAWVATVDGWEKATDKASEKSPVTQTVDGAAFEWPFANADESKEHNVRRQGSDTLVFTAPLDAPTKNALIGAGAPREWRTALKGLERLSLAARVGAIWLILSYLLATIGELCLSPVGLSMVTKLAPTRYASLFMGVWLLASSVAQYVGGAIGESWGKITPTSYFTVFVWTSLVGVGVLVVLVSPLRKLMHKVH